MWYAESGTEGDSQKTPFAIEVGVFSPTFPKLLGHLAPTTGLITHLDLGCEGVAGHWKIKSGLGTGGHSSWPSRQEGWDHRLKVGDKLSCS